MNDLTRPNAPESGLPLCLDALSAWFKAAADPLRLLILRVLAQESYGVLELSRILAVKQSGMSHHLKLLASVGILSTRREGNSVYYQRAWPQSGVDAPLQEQLWRSVDELILMDEVLERIESVRTERTAQAQVFFEQNSQRFRQHQDLIACYSVYGKPVEHLLESLSLSHSSRALEVGPGEGELLPALAKQCDQVWAVDISAALLAKAKAHCHNVLVDKHSTNNIHWHCGDASQLPPDIGNMDLIVVNMVLHHLPSPAELFQSLQSILNRRGVLVITELCEHQHDWVKESCGDLWLGFSPEALNQWAMNAGLTVGPANYLALRNGFQIQIRQFYQP